MADPGTGAGSNPYFFGGDSISTSGGSSGGGGSSGKPLMLSRRVSSEALFATTADAPAPSSSGSGSGPISTTVLVGGALVGLGLVGLIVFAATRKKKRD